MNMKETLVNAENYCQECNKFLKRCSENDREDCWIYHAIKSMIRAVPEKPIVKGKDAWPDRIRYYCTSCNRQLTHGRNMKFCPRCGKAIDWEV